VSGVLLTLWLAVAMTPQMAAAASPDWRLSDYVHTEWTHHDGVPLARLERILQTPDGYLWIITRDEGVLRFDGMRFVPVPVPCRRPVSQAASGSDGSLWFSCGYRLLRRTPGGQIVEVPQSFLPAQGPEADVHVDSRGRVWVFFLGSGYLVEPDGTRFKRIYHQAGGRVMTWAEDSDGTMWLSDTHRVVRVRDNNTEVLPFEGVFGLTRAPSGGVIACSGDTVWHLQTASQSVMVRAPRGVTFGNYHGAMSVGADGGLWIGTRQHGIALVQDGRVEMLPEASQMGGLVISVFIDREDTVWVGAASGLHRLRKPRARLMSSLVGHLEGPPLFAFADSRDGIWVGDSGRVTRIDPISGARHDVQGRYSAISEDKTGRIWLASASDVGYVSDDAFVPVRDDATRPVSHVHAFTKDDQGDVWALAEGVGLYRVTPGSPRRVVDAPDAAVDFVVSSRHGSWIALDWKRGGGFLQHVDGRETVFQEIRGIAGDSSVQTIVEDGESIWFGAFSGLARWRRGKWTMWTREHGLPGRGAVLEIAADRFERFWLMTSGGILVVPRAQLDGTPDGAPRPLTFARIGSLDRVLPHLGGMRPSPRVTSDRSGRLYFVTFDSVAIVDPSAVTESSLKPTIVIESMAADNRPADLTAATRPLVEPSRLDFEYTSLSLRSPENIRFRYKLEGVDADWIEAGSQRHVTYGTLKPGGYRFRVIGSGSEGVWNEVGASVALQIVPSFRHTWWFRLTLVGLGTLTLLLIHVFRMQKLTRQLNMRFEERLAERTRIARDLHDTLLQRALAASLHVQVANDSLTDDVPASPVIDQALPPLRRAMQLLSEMVEESRATVQGLRVHSPKDPAEALRQLARDQPNHDEIEFSLTVEGSVRPLHPRISDEIWHIAREAVVNAYRHSSARHVNVTFVYTRTDFRCVVRDDGQGMDATVLERGREGHWGLKGMRERAETAGAELRLRSSEQAGTEVELRIKGQIAFADARAS
jgi:signal transduction histidine kinase/ligand-binding sensor domain-containing protein